MSEVIDGIRVSGPWHTAAAMSRDGGNGEELCIACRAHCDGSTRGQVGDTSGALCPDCAHYCDGNVTAPVCRACRLWEWDGSGSLPFNPDAGPCAHCGGQHADLYGGVCRDCYGAGYREACARPNCRR